MKDLIVSILRDAIERARAAGQLSSEIPSIGIEAPRDSAHGDVASNIALTLAKRERKPPRAIAEIIKSQVTLPAEVSEVTVAGPGFINFKMSPAYWHFEMRRPPTVGHGRNAVLGDTIARLYEAAGFDVTREYYFNDGGRQMKLLGESVRARYLQAHGIDATMPPDRYQGEYIVDIARALKADRGDSLISVTDLEIFRSVAVKAIFADINQTCTRLGIRFDVFTNELDLFNDGKVSAV